MPQPQEVGQQRVGREKPIPVSVIVPTRNEAANLPRCLESLRSFGEVCVIDSQSDDATIEIARSYNAKVIQFFYKGGWPKKRQWAMENLPFSYDWVLLIDADEVLTTELADEIERVSTDINVDGYYVKLQMFFLNRLLRY